MASIYEALKTAGVPLDHWQSDLYAKVNDDSRRIVREFMARGELHSRPGVFSANDGSGLWYDLPFQFDPFWKSAVCDAEMRHA